MTVIEQIIQIKTERRMRGLPGSNFSLRYGREFHTLLKKDLKRLNFVFDDHLPRKLTFLGVNLIRDFRYKTLSPTPYGNE